jgi:quinol monooxygenase YgiN
MDRVVTMVQGRVEPEQEQQFRDAFPADSVDDLPDFLLGTMLVHESGSDRWAVVTLWRDRAALDEYRRSVDTPGAVAAFRAVGVEPEVTIWDADRVLMK